MSQQVISYADLTVINDALRSVASNMSGINSELEGLNFKQDQLENELLKLAVAFAEFVQADLKLKSLQLAETRQGNLKQDLQIKYGYYAEVRRMATGILQSVDTGVVSDDTLRHTTEEVMIKVPGYWLAPALVAIASWIRDDKLNTEKAVSESLRRDDYKSTLFFMLVMRRLSRYDACLKWMERYFMHQNPHDLDREFIIVMEAVTTGIFPPASRQLMMSNVKQWLELLTQGDTYINEQKVQWIKFFEANGPLSNGKYPLLQKFAINWNALNSSLREAKTHEILKSYFNDIFTSSSDFSKSIKVQLDEILTLLVTNFDDEELPLRQEIRLNELIIQMEGDKKAAQALMDTEKYIFSEKVDFLQILTNSAFNPELSGGTAVTQALAISISQPWIIEAHDSFTANCRNRIPFDVALNIGGFITSTQNGSDEEAQLQKHEEYWLNILELEITRLSFPYGTVIIGVLIILLGLWALSVHVITGLIGIGIGGVLIWNSVNNYNKAKLRLKENIEERKKNSREVLRGCIAETVDYRKESEFEDSKAEELRELLNSITPEDFSSVSKDTARNII